MLNAVRDVLRNDQIEYENFYYAFCQKKPQKKLVFSKIEQWTDVETPLQDIFKKQLEFIIKSKFNIMNFKGASTNSVLLIDRNIDVPDGQQLPADKPVMEILESIFSTDKEDMDEIKELGDMLSLKYLTAKYSRPSIYGMLTFKVIVDTVERNFVFITLCDIELEREDLLVDETRQVLAAKKIKNVFKEKELTKGVLFPYVDSDSHDDGSLLLHEDADKKTMYWAEAFECKTRLSRKAEKEAFHALISTHFIRNEKVSTSEVARIFDKTREIPKNDIGSEDWGKILRDTNREVSEDSLLDDWRNITKSPEMTLTKESILADRTDYVFKMGKVEVKVKPEKLKDVHQFTHDGKPYLVIKGDEPAVFDGVNKEIEGLSWEDFKAKIDNE